MTWDGLLSLPNCHKNSQINLYKNQEAYSRHTKDNVSDNESDNCDDKESSQSDDLINTNYVTCYRGKPNPVDQWQMFSVR